MWHDARLESVVVQVVFVSLLLLCYNRTFRTLFVGKARPRMTLESLTLPEITFYVTGGTLPPDAASYVAREADHLLFDNLMAGEYCYVLNSRQMGKSSLCVRTIGRLKEQGVTTVFLDLTKFGGSNITAEQWYAGMLSEFGRACGLRTEFLGYWKENGTLSPLQRFFSAIQEVALSRVEDRLVFFIDEIDVTRSLPFSTDEFFAAIRQCYVGRATQPVLKRLMFCLLGTATPADLIQDMRVSPFNIGKRIELRDFTEVEAQPLAEGLGAQGRVLLERVLYWTGGHPYLTQRLCRTVAESGVQNASEVDRLCTELFLTHTAQEADDNLAFVRNRLLKSEVDLAALLDLYAKMRSGKPVSYDETNPLCPILRLSGVAKVREGMLLVRNRIYAHVFDKEWVEAHMPDAEKRRQQQAYRAGLIRASAVAGCVALAMSLLAAFAFNQRGDALRNAQAARNLTKLANDQTSLAKANAEKERLARNDADRNANGRSVALAEAEKQRTIAVTNQEMAARNLRLANENLAAVSKAQNATAAEKAHALNEATLARLAEEKTRRLLYVSDMNVAQQAYEENNVARTLELLYQHRNAPERGFEWRYLYHLCHLELSSVTGHLEAPTPNSSITFSPDGKRMVTSNWEIEAKVWDVTTGNELFSLKGHTRQITALAFSPDSKQIVTGSLDNTGRVWDAATGKELFSLKGNSGVIVCIAFSRDGKHIVTGSYDNITKVWDAATGKEELFLKWRTQPLSSVAFSWDDKRIVAGSGDGTARVWDAATGKVLFTLSGHSQPITAIAFSPDSKRMVTGSSDNTAKVWDAAKGTELFTLKGHTSAVACIAFALDGNRIVTGSSDGTAKVWDAATGKDLFTFKGHTGSLISTAFSSDGRRIVTRCSDGTVKVWDAMTDVAIRVLKGTNQQYMTVAFSADLKRIVTGNGAGMPKVRDAATGKEVMSLKGAPGSITSVAFSPDGKRIVMSSGYGMPTVWDATTGKELLTLKGNIGFIMGIAFSPDGKRIVTGSYDSIARVWDAATGKEELSLKGHTQQISSVTFSPDGKRIATGSADYSAKVWDAATGKEQLSLNGHGNAVTSIAFSPDGKNIVTGSADGTAKVWDAVTGRESITIKRNSNIIYSVAFSPDGKRIVTGSYDKAARVWDAQTGTELLSMAGHTAWVVRVAFSPDGNRIVTGTQDGAVSIWEGPPVAAEAGAWRDIETQLATSYEQAGKWPKAILALSDMIQEEPGVLSYRWRRGQAYAEAYQWREALPDFRAAIPTYRTPGQWGPLALVYCASGDETNYRRTCETLLQKYGGDPQNAQGIGEICNFGSQALQDYTPLLALLHKQIEKQPDLALSTTLGMLQYRAGHYADCVRTLTPLLNDQSAPEAWLCLALAHNQQGEKAEARKLLARGEAGLPQVRDIKRWYWKLRYEVKLREARASIGTPDPRMVVNMTREIEQRSAWSQEAGLYEQPGQWAKAVPILSKLIQSDPDRMEYRRQRGAAYAEMGAWPQALADYKVFGLASQNLRDEVELGLLYLATGDNQGYRVACRSLFERLPSAVSYSGWLCHAGPDALRDYSPLLATVAATVKQHPESVDTALQLGSLQYRAGKLPEALRTLTGSMQPDTPNADYWFILAMAHFQSGQAQEAKKAFDTGVQAMLLGAFVPDRMSDEWAVQLHWQIQLHEAATALKMQPADVAGIENKVRLIRQARQYERMHQWPQAIAALTGIIQADPENLQYVLWRGSAYRQSGHLPETLADYRHNPLPALPPASLPKSGNNTSGTEILFYNNSANAVKLFWIGSDGKPVYYADIPPHADYLQSTSVAHVWQITDMGGKPLVGFVARPIGGLALIEAK